MRSRPISSAHGRLPRVLTLVLLWTFGVASASETGLTGGEGHPRARFPLALRAPTLGEAALDAVVRKAVADWNAIGQATLGVTLFRWTDEAAAAEVRLDFEPARDARLMGSPTSWGTRSGSRTWRTRGR